MLRILFRNNAKGPSISKSLRIKIPFKTQAYFKELTDEDLFNTRFIRKLVKTKPQGHTYKAMRGLYSGKLVRNRHKITFSDKKTKKKQAPNVQKKVYFSDILQKEIKLHVTTNTMRNIRKYGSFDNYILLFKPSKMVSMFGEYLRELMFRKINNPEMDLESAKIFGTTPDVCKNSKKKEGRDGTHYFANYRHKDKTLDRMRYFTEYSKRELEMVS